MNRNYPIRKEKCGEEQEKKGLSLFMSYRPLLPLSPPFRRKGKCGEEQENGVTLFMSYHLPFAAKENAVKNKKKKKDLTLFMSYRPPFAFRPQGGDITHFEKHCIK